MMSAIKIFIYKAKAYLYAAAILAFLATGATAMKFRRDAISYKYKSEINYANYVQFSAIANRLSDENRVLRLTADDLLESNDSLLRKMDEYARKINGGKNARTSDVIIGSNEKIVIRDTVFVDTPVECKIDTVVRPNDETNIAVNLDSGMLKISTDINNTEILYVHSKREFVNKYSSWWKRLWRFDWKKRDFHRYNIENSNSLIKTKDIRVVKIEE